MGLMNDINASLAPATLLGDAALESEITLAAIREHCSSDEEFNNLIQESAIEMALYGIIDDAEAAMEASKKIVIKDYKSANMNKIVARTAIRLAKKDNATEYKKYNMHRTKMLEARQAIYKKYGSRAKVEAKKIIQNSRRKASNMDNTKSGRSIVDKMDKEIASQESKNKAKR